MIQKKNSYSRTHSIEIKKVLQNSGFYPKRVTELPKNETFFLNLLRTFLFKYEDKYSVSSRLWIIQHIQQQEKRLEWAKNKIRTIKIEVVKSAQKHFSINEFSWISPIDFHNAKLLLVSVRILARKL